MKAHHFAMDLGTTNSVIACWNEELECPEIVHLDPICRGSQQKKDLDDSYTIPSCVFLKPPSEVLSFPFNWLFRRFKSRTGGLVGMEAIRQDGGVLGPRFVRDFKSHLGKNSYQFIGRLGKWQYTAEEIARIFLKGVFYTLRKNMGARPSTMTFCVPVDFYEFYRARLRRIASHVGVGRIKTIDEPVAAALGYGLSLEDNKHILVIDFGAGTLDLALIRSEEKTGDRGSCTVLAKQGMSVGGNLIDAWIVEDICAHFEYAFDRLSRDQGIRWWYRMLLREACRLKETLFLKEQETFYFMPSSLMAQYARRVMGKQDPKKPVDYTKNDLANLLERRGLYTLLDNLIDDVLSTAEQKGLPGGKVDEVIMVGGSTLLPKVYAQVEKRFGRDRVRAWQPFNAVAFGAAAFAAGRLNKADYITHDYAFVTYDRKTHEPEYNIIVPAGTTFPTAPDFWKRQLTPTCALGEPETIFKLMIYEIGRKHAPDHEFVWDEKGELHSLSGESKKRLIIPLNESDPTLGYLRPPHYPSEKRPRVEISFMVNEDKWLCTTVFDLKTGRNLLTEKPVIRLK